MLQVQANARAQGCPLLEDEGSNLDVREPQLTTLQRDQETNAMISLTPALHLRLGASSA